MDYSKLSNEDLANLISINRLESNGAGPSSTITNPDTGASGNMQVMKSTAKDPGYGVKPSNGTPEDTSREGADYYLAMKNKYKDPTIAAMAYNWGPGNVDKWLASGADYSKVPDETLKYAINHAKQPNGATNAPSGKPAAPAAAPDNGVMANLKGLGVQAANLGVGALEAIPAGVIGIGNALSQGSPQAGVEAATKFMGDYSGEKGLQALGIDTSTAEGSSIYKGINHAMDFAFNTAPEWIANQSLQGSARELLSGGGMAPDEQTVQQVANAATPDMKAALQLGMLAEPLAHVPGMIGKFGNKDAAAAAELDKLRASQEPSMAPNTGAPMGPNEGPQLPKAQQDLFPETLTNPEGHAETINPNQLSSEVQQPISLGNNLRQRNFGFDRPESSFLDEQGRETGPAPLLDQDQPMAANREGLVGTPDQVGEAGQFRDAMAKRVDEFNKKDPEQLGLFDEPTNRDRPFDDRGGDEAPRQLSRDEFEQTMQTLKDSGKYDYPTELPQYMDSAYDHYLNMTSDKQGGLFDRPTIAKNFAEQAAKEAIARRVEDHPVVKANLAKLEELQNKQVGNMRGAQSALDYQIAKAQDLLDKSRENIGKQLEPAAKAVAPYAKEGTVYMHTFGHLPTLMKSLGAVLKGLHGIVFKTLDKALPNMKNLDSGAKIMAQGVKDFVNREARRDWSQTVNARPRETLKGVPGLRDAIKEFDPYEEGQQLPIEEIKNQAREAPDLSSGIRDSLTNHLAQGGLMLTNMTRNPIIKYVSESVDRAVRDSRAWVRDNITGKDGLQRKMQKMSNDELTGIRSLMEMNEGKRDFSEAELRSKGFSDKQIDYYKKRSELIGQAFQRLNEGRARAGLPPVEKRLGYIAGYFMGDFKRVITDSEGKVRAVLAHNTRQGLNVISKRFMETHPEAKDFKLGDISMTKLKDEVGAADSRFQGYMNVLNDLKDTNADVAAVVDAYKNYMQRDAAAAMQNRAKFKSKEGVIGAEGRKSWQSATKNAIDGARQELRYLESMSKWSEMQKAIEKAKDVLGDESIDKPEAKRVAQQYVDGVQGRNQGAIQRAMNGIVNAVAETTGIGPSIWKGMNNTTKSLALMKFVGVFKLSHSLVTLMQPMQSMPGLNSLLKARGADLGMTQVSSLFKGLNSSFNLFKGDTKDPFVKQMADYMKANGTADVGMSTHLQNVTSRSAKMATAKHIGELNVTIPEQGARTFVFSYYAHMLKDLGLEPKEAMATAHNLMRYAMVDYAPHERSMMFGKMGIMGDIASTLTRFKYNQISQHMVGATEVQRGGSVAPLMTVIASSLVAGGIRGVFAYEAANQVIDHITKWLAQAGVMKKPTNLDEIVLKTLGGLNNSTFSNMANWGVTSAFGINMTGSLTNADTIPTDPLGALVPYRDELTNLGSKALDLAVQPNTQNAKRFVQQALPNSMKGLGENMMFTDEKGNYMNPNTGELEARRSSTDELKRAFSFRPIEESKRKLVATVGTEHEKAITDIKHTILERAKRDMDSQGGRLTQDQLNKYTDQYTKDLGGDPGSFVNDMVAFLGKGKHLDALQRAQGIPTGKSLSEVTRYMRFEDLKGNKNDDSK